MLESHVQVVAAELSVQPRQVAAAAALLGEGATVPFIARYRKEATGSLDEVAIARVRDRLAQLAELDERRAAILASLEERELLTDELRRAVDGAETMTALEDVYAPYRPKRRTRATIAREAGLEPLADLLFDHQDDGRPRRRGGRLRRAREERARRGGRPGRRARHPRRAGQRRRGGRARAAAAVLGAGRGDVRRSCQARKTRAPSSRTTSTGREPVAGDPEPPHARDPARRGRGRPARARRAARGAARSRCSSGCSSRAAGRPAGEQVRLAVHDGYKRLLGPAIEGEIRARVEEAGRRRGDPRLRRQPARAAARAAARPEDACWPSTRASAPAARWCASTRRASCCTTTSSIPTAASPAQAQAGGRHGAARWSQRFAIEAIAIGNGTAGRETEAFVRAPRPARRRSSSSSVNESGASIYSASEVAREEFPDQDVTVRGAVSIGRRLMDPLAELVKIDPKSIGVGQYQHDVDQGALKRGLDDVVVSCVNGVGVELNTASKQLLALRLRPRAGAGREDRRAPRRERALPVAPRRCCEVPRLGPKAFEQARASCASAAASTRSTPARCTRRATPWWTRMARDLGCAVADLLRDATLRARIDAREVRDRDGRPADAAATSSPSWPSRAATRGGSSRSFRFAEGVEKTRGPRSRG